VTTVKEEEMASGMWGADASELDELSRSLGSASHRLDTIAQRLRSDLGSAPWTGTDAQRFRSAWQDQHGPALAVVSRLLAETSTRVASHAQEQRAASSASGTGIDGAGATAAVAGGTTWLAARATATRAIMERDLAELRQQLAAEERNARWSVVEHAKGLAPGMATDAEMLRERIARMEAFLTGGATLLSYSDLPGDHRIVQVHGDLATATRVIVHVPGLSTDLDSYLPGAHPDDPRLGHHDALSVFDEAQRQAGGGVAVISFLDYNVPTGGVGPIPDVFEAANRAGAESGATALRALVQELSDQGQSVSVVAHSYGTLVTGVAMEQGLAADVVVALGSPGMGIDGTTSSMPKLFVGDATGDYVTGYGQFVEGHGADPRSFADGMVDVSGAALHSSYFEGASLENVVEAVLGRR
jgi:uncharacterized protein YukE